MNIRNFMTADHSRLDRLLDKARDCTTEIELASFDQFRKGLLKHISMEEKILLPMLRTARGGKPFEAAVRLRLDHGAIASLLAPPPSPLIIAIPLFPLS